MNENLTDELISAYLDDELSLDERKQVEELLMDSAEHRRMFEELRALRQGLHSLPKHRLDADFARRVLHRAEREMLTGPLRETDAAPSTPPNDAAAKTATNDQSLSDEPPIVKFGATVAGASERRSLRVAIMAISAVAAALLLTFVLAPPGALEDFVPVAVHEEHVDDAAGRTDSAETAGSAEKAANQIGDIAETDAFNIAPGAAESPVDQITEDQQPAAKKFAEAEALEYADKEPMERRNAATAFDRTSPPNVGASKPADDGDHLETFKRQQQANADVTPAETAAAGSIAPGGVSTSEEIEGAKDYKYFFTVDLSQEDFAAGAMDRTLRQSGVAVYDASDKELARDKPAVSGADAKNRDESAAALALSTRQFESAKLEAAQHRGVEAFDVEATPEQIAIVLATLQAQSGQGLKAVALGQESKADAVIHFGQFAAREKFKYAQFGGLEGMRKAEGGIERLDIPQADNGFGGAGLPAAKPANVPPERTRRSIHESLDEPRGAAVPAPSAPRAKDEAGEEQRSQLGRPGAARMMRVAPAAEEDIGNRAKFDANADGSRHRESYAVRLSRDSLDPQMNAIVGRGLTAIHSEATTSLEAKTIDSGRIRRGLAETDGIEELAEADGVEKGGVRSSIRPEVTLNESNAGNTPLLAQAREAGASATERKIRVLFLLRPAETAPAAAAAETIPANIEPAASKAASDK